MASRRTVITRDRMRNSLSRKRTHRATLEHAQRNAELLARLIRQAREQAKEKAAGD